MFNVKALRTSLLLAALGAALAASAAPVAYTFSANVYGEFNGSALVNQPVILRLFGDTDDVTSSVFNGTLIHRVPGTASVTLTGLGTYAFTDPFEVYSADTSDAGIGVDGYGTLLGLLDLSLKNYDLKSSFGPLAGSALAGTQTFGTSGGDLYIHTVGPTNSDKVTFTAVVRPVPEPASMAALGLGAVAVLRRRKRA